jgi:hypothetical protein
MNICPQSDNELKSAIFKPEKDVHPHGERLFFFTIFPNNTTKKNSFWLKWCSIQKIEEAGREKAGCGNRGGVGDTTWNRS